MPANFQKTLGALNLERRSRRRVLLASGFAVAILGVWVAWFAFGRVPVYAVSVEARIQAGEATHPVDVHIAGRVVASHLHVGSQVRVGEVLLALDDADIALEIAAAEARLQGLERQAEALETEIGAREQAIAETEKAGRAEVAEAAAWRRESQLRAGLARAEGERLEQLHKAGVVADAERARAQSGVQESAAAATARSRRLAVLQANTDRELADRRAVAAELTRALAGLRAERDSAAVAVAQLQEQRARHVLRAPVAGRLGQVQAPRVGASVAAGETLAVITPEDTLTISAQFASADVVGRIAVGQSARMRADGFPWTQYGTLSARVTAISGEPRAGLVRVQLAIVDAESTSIPVRHGIDGAVELQLEEVAPATLVLRAVGGLAGAGRDRD